MKYSEDTKVYNIIVEDDCDDCYVNNNPDIEELDDNKFKFTGTLQEFGESLESCGYRQEDIKESIDEFVSSGFEPHSGPYSMVFSGSSCYFYLEDK